MSKYKHIIFALIILLLAGCQTAPNSTIGAPTAQTLRIDVTPATAWMLPALNQCQQETPGLNLTVQEISTRQLNTDESDLLIISGEPELANSYAVEIAKTALVFVVNSANPVQEIPLVTLKKMFSGQISLWSEIDPTLPAEPIQVWIPPSSDEMWESLETHLFDVKSVSKSANIAPDGDAMLASISSDKSAIGILPQPLLRGSVKAINTETELSVPIIAVAQSEPHGLLREFLLCLQAYQVP